MGWGRRLNGSYHFPHISAPCTPPIKDKSWPFTPLEVPTLTPTPTPTTHALSWAKAWLWKSELIPGSEELSNCALCYFSSSTKGQVGLSAYLEQRPSCPHGYSAPPPAGTMVGLSLLIRPEGLGGSLFSSLMKHLLPGDQGSAVETLWLPALSHLVCSRASAPLAIYPRTSVVQRPSAQRHPHTWPFTNRRACWDCFKKAELSESKK